PEQPLGRSKKEGPGPPWSIRWIGFPSRRVPVIRCAEILRFVGEVQEVRDTQRILLAGWRAGGEALSGYEKRIGTIAPEWPSTCGIRCVEGWKPPRAQTGSVPLRTAELQGSAVEALPADVEAERIVSAATTAGTATHLCIAFMGTPPRC